MAKKKAKSLPKAITKDEMKLLYMDSPHLAWATFCQSIGVDAITMKSEYPSALWRAEKRRNIINAERERLKDMVVENMSGWIKDVQFTMQKYPQVADAALSIIAHKINSLKEIAEKKEMHKVDSSELSSLASAINTIVQAKHKALMITEFNIDLNAVMDSASQIPEDETKTDAPRQLEIVIKHSGKENYKDDMNSEDRFAEYYDWNKKTEATNNELSVANQILPPEVKDIIRREDKEDADELQKLLDEAENL